MWNVSQAWIFRTTDVGEKNMFTQPSGRGIFSFSRINRFFWTEFASRLITFEWRRGFELHFFLRQWTHYRLLNNARLNGGPIGRWFIERSDLIYGDSIYLTFSPFAFFSARLSVSRHIVQWQICKWKEIKGTERGTSCFLATINKTHHCDLLQLSASEELSHDLCRRWNWFSFSAESSKYLPSNC